MTEREDYRSLAVGLIWLGAGLAIGLTNINSQEINVFNMFITLFIALGALSSTVVLLRGPEYSKAKRDNAASDDYSNLLLQLMSDDEKKALRSRLINNVATDGEIFAPDDVDMEKEHITS